MPSTRSQYAVREVDHSVPWSEEFEEIVHQAEVTALVELTASRLSLVTSIGRGTLVEEAQAMVNPEGGVQQMPAAQTKSKFRYKDFKGGSKDDPDEWLEDFAAKANANGEFPAICQLLPAVLVGEARKWYKKLPDATKYEWEAFVAAFKKEFRPSQEKRKVIKKLGTLRMKKHETMRKLMQRFYGLIEKMSTDPSDELKRHWLLNSFPIEMRNYVSQFEPTSLNQVESYGRRYVELFSQSSKSKSKKKSKSSSGDSNSYDSSTDEADSDSDSSDAKDDSEEDDLPYGKRGRKKAHHKKKQASKRDTFAVGVSVPRGVTDQLRNQNDQVNELARKLESLRVHLTETPPARKKLPLVRAHVWCAKCSGYGHTPRDCPTEVNFVQESGDDSYYHGSMAQDPVYQLQVAEADQRKAISSGPRPAMPRPAAGGSQDHRRGGACYNCGSPNHYSSHCPEPRKQGNGAPIPLCPVCKKDGHTIVHCPYVLAAKAQVQEEVNSAATKPGAKTILKKGNFEAHVRFLEADAEIPDQKSTWLYQEEFPGMDTDTQTSETSCYKVSTRSTRQKEKRLERESRKTLKKTAAAPTLRSKVVPAEDSDYNREHPKLFFPAVENSVKKALEEEEERQQLQALKKDQEEAEKRRQIERVDSLKPNSQLQIRGQAGIYDIRKDVQECNVTATIGQLLADNPLYRSQLRELLRVRKRRMPKNLGVDVRLTAVEDLGAPEIEVSINGMLLSHVPVDGGAGVNVMTGEVANQLGYNNFQSTHKVVRLADGSRVLPLGVLTNISVIIGEHNFLLNFLVLKIERKTSYPVLLGRPWLYAAKAKVDWRRQVILFGSPRSKICWSQDKYRGETSEEEASYDSGGESEAESLLLQGLTCMKEEECHVLQVEEEDEQSLDITPQVELKVRETIHTLGEDEFSSTCPKDRERGTLTSLLERICNLQHLEGSTNLQTIESHTKGAQVHLKEGNHEGRPGGERLGRVQDQSLTLESGQHEVALKQECEKFKLTNDIELNVGKHFEQKEALLKLLEEYKDIFAASHMDLTGVNLELGEHKIDLFPGSLPIRQRQHRMNPKYSLMVKAEIDKLLEAGFIFPVPHSEWVSPIVVVPKKPGPNGERKIRVCQDYRKLNQATKKDHHPLPFSDVVLDVVAGHQAYSFLDGYAGYNQVWIRKQDQLLTSFTTEWGVFAFCRMPFGLCNAPATFQRLMMTIFQKYLRQFIEIFIDDFAVYSSGAEHLKCLELTFQRCRDTNLKLHPEKCFFVVQQGNLLGHIVSARGIEIDQSKVLVWLSIKFPSNPGEVRGFLGCTGYYRRFIRYYANIARPLNLMLRKDSDFSCTPEREESFQALKRKLVEAPVLVAPDWSKEFHVQVDTSLFCIGLVLSQLDDQRRDHPIYFASRQLSIAEVKYSCTEREALGIIFACKKFRHYLLGCKVIFHTDHDALKHMVNKPDVTGRIARWIVLLQEFDYEVKVRPGKQHANADFFSRLDGVPSLKNVDDCFPDETLFQVNINSDSWYGELLLFLQTGQLRNNMTAEEAAVLLRKARPYYLVKGLLHKEGADGRAYRCLEKGDVRTVMQAMHEGEVGGHFAKERTTRKILAAGYWWPTLHKDVHQYVRNCDQCQRSGGQRRNQRYTLHPILPLAPFEKWGIDFIGPITPTTSSRHCRYILLSTDYCTRWVEARATAKDDAHTVARFLYEQIFSRFGAPLQLVSDRGTHFLNEIVADLNDTYLVKHRKSTPYHPRTNGLTEKANGLVVGILAKILAVHKRDWDVKLFSAVHAYNTSYKVSLKQTPYFLVFGQNPIVPVEFQVQTMRTAVEERMQEDLSLMQRIYQLEALEETRSEALQALYHHQSMLKTAWDKKVRVIDYQQGDLVLLFDSRYQHFKGKGKLHTRWLGPYLVKNMYSNGSVQLTTLDGEEFPTRVHYERTKKYYFRE
jgi:transposase InsO family protein